MSQLVKSKRFWAAVSSLAVVLIGDKLPLSPEQINDLVMVVAVWIVGDSLRSVVPVDPRKR